MIIHHYYYIYDREYIELFDRFANQPIWYAIGLGATMIFMGGLYFMLKSKRQNNITITDAVAPHDSEMSQQAPENTSPTDETW